MKENDLVKCIERYIQINKWKPNYIVGVIPDGLIASVYLSRMMKKPLYTVSKNESNLWMSEDAYNGKKILIIDQNDRKFNWIKKDWESSCFPNDREVWDKVWGKTVRFMTIEAVRYWKTNLPYDILGNCLYDHEKRSKKRT